MAALTHCAVAAGGILVVATDAGRVLGVAARGVTAEHEGAAVVVFNSARFHAGARVTAVRVAGGSNKGATVWSGDAAGRVAVHRWTGEAADGGPFRRQASRRGCD